MQKHLSKEAIYVKATQVLSELFDIQPDSLSFDSRLREDLDIDSIDAVDLLIDLKNHVGVEVEAHQFRQARTLGDIVEIVQNLQVEND